MDLLISAGPPSIAKRGLADLLPCDIAIYDIPASVEEIFQAYQAGKVRVIAYVVWDVRECFVASIEYNIETACILFSGLMMESEKKIFEMMNKKAAMSKYWMPLVWATNIINRARKEALITSDHVVQTLLVELSDIRKRLGALIGYDTVCVPLVYTQVSILAYLIIIRWANHLLTKCTILTSWHEIYILPYNYSIYLWQISIN